MTAAERKESRAAREAAQWRADNAHMIGQLVVNAGRDLTLGREWDTPDGFRVWQVEVIPDSSELGHFYGRVEVLGFAAGKAAPAMDALDVQREANKAAEAMMRTLGCNCTKAVRTMARASVLEMYRIAVEFQGVERGMQSAWLKGWRKGYGAA